MESWFENVGAKIKGLAIGTFVVEAIASIIGGFAMIVDDSDLMLVGFITIFGGVIAALITAWFLYGFGELIEKTTENEQHNREILSLLRKREENLTPERVTVIAPKAQQSSNEKAVSQPQKREFVQKETTAPYWCGKCGHEGPYDTFCPECGSSIHIYRNPTVTHSWLCSHCGKRTTKTPCEHCGK